MSAALFATMALPLASAGRYGYHRDERFLLVAGDRLVWGFVDQPPVTPAIGPYVRSYAPAPLVAPGARSTARTRRHARRNRPVMLRSTPVSAGSVGRLSSIAVSTSLRGGI